MTTPGKYRRRLLLRLGFIIFTITMALALQIPSCTFRQAPEPRKKPYVIAFPSHWHNIQLYGTGQSVTGFSSNLLYGISRAANIEIQLVMRDPEAFSALLERGDVDAILTALPVNTITERFFEFTDPYFVSGTVIVVGIHSPYKKTGDMKNVEIAYDRAEGIDIVIGAKPTWLLRPYDSPTHALEDVIKEHVDGMILNFINASRLHRSLYRSKIRILVPPLVTQNLRLAVRRGKNPELVELFNIGIQEFIKSGKYKELLEYWGIDSQLSLELQKS